MADNGARHAVELGKPFGHENGLAELTIDKPDGRGRIDLFARVQPDSCLCARIFDDNSRFLSPAGIDDTGAGEMYQEGRHATGSGQRCSLGRGRECVCPLGR